MQKIIQLNIMKIIKKDYKKCSCKISKHFLKINTKKSNNTAMNDTKSNRRRCKTS